MKNKVLLAVATALGISAVATTAIAAPLPAGTTLTIVKGVVDPAAPYTPCPTGSCFSMFLFAGLYAWMPLGPGTDGGIIIGKGQLSGGQETNPLSTNNGELTEVWSFVGSTGTFFTAPSDAGNVFDDASCAGSGCGSNTTPRLTDLAVWNMAWSGIDIPLGSAAGCNPLVTPACTADEIAGIFVSSWTIDPAGTVPRKYSLVFDQVLSVSPFTNVPYRLILRGDVACIPDACGGLVVIVVSPSNLVGVYGIPIPFTINVIDPSGPAPTCRVGTVPANGAVALNGCTSGTYTGDVGFVGTNTFTIIANNSFIDSQPALVNVAVTAPSPTPTVIVDGCPMIYPVSQATLIGKKGHLSITVTGNLISVNPNGKEIKICPTTTATYAASTDTPGATVVCQVKSNTGRGKGSVKVNDHIKCTDKPVGNDKLYIKIKSGVYQKAV